MLDELRVQNVALIEDASLAPASGLTVLQERRVLVKLLFYLLLSS